MLGSENSLGSIVVRNHLHCPYPHKDVVLPHASPHGICWQYLTSQWGWELEIRWPVHFHFNRDYGGVFLKKIKIYYFQIYQTHKIILKHYLQFYQWKYCLHIYNWVSILKIEISIHKYYCKLFINKMDGLSVIFLIKNVYPQAGIMLDSIPALGTNFLCLYLGILSTTSSRAPRPSSNPSPFIFSTLINYYILLYWSIRLDHFYFFMIISISLSLSLSILFSTITLAYNILLLILLSFIFSTLNDFQTAIIFYFIMLSLY